MDKKIWIAVGLSFLTVFLFNYWMKQPEVSSTNQVNINQVSTSQVVPAQAVPGQAYKVPTQQDLAKPINLEIDFIDKKITQAEQVKDLSTDLYNISFSNYGAVISSIEFKKHLGKNKTPLKTITPKSFYQREEGAFLLALEEKTPYFYELVDIKESENQKVITYQVLTENWVIRKIYTIYNNSYKIDLDLEFISKLDNNLSIKPRIFFPAPFVSEIQSDDKNGFVIDVDGKTVRTLQEKDLGSAFITPGIFGLQDKYFAHGLSLDKNSFTQRAFYKKVQNNIYSILEGPEIKQKANYSLSFYVGPKLVDDLVLVDNRLQDLLSFGWLSWICKMLLKLLEFLFNYLGSFGLAIILLALLIKIPFIPLTLAGGKKLEEFQRHQPSINRIRLKYKDNLQLQQVEIMKYYKDHNISPTAPVVGCLPILIQLPILFALNKVLSNYLDLYQAPFLGWIKDLSSKDPYYILPLLMLVSMIWQQMLTPSPDEKQRVMMLIMPIVFTAMFINFSSGLVLYWLANNLFTIGETYLRKRVYR